MVSLALITIGKKCFNNNNENNNNNEKKKNRKRISRRRKKKKTLLAQHRKQERNMVNKITNKYKIKCSLRTAESLVC